MKITHHIDSFLFELFPNAKGTEGDNVALVNEITKYYSIGPFKPQVTIEDNTIKIEIDSDAITKQEPEYRKVVALCEKGRFSEAKPILSRLITVNPTLSEYHRIIGQILSEEGNLEEGINCLIDALRWDPKNGYALLMMGNIQFKQKDADTAMLYFEQALVVNPEDIYALNNIGANLIQSGKYNVAKSYLERGYNVNPKYPNTAYALGIISANAGDDTTAFDYFVQSLKNNTIGNQLYDQTIAALNEVSRKLVAETDVIPQLKGYITKLEYDGKVPIDEVVDDTIPTAAKIEFAEVKNRDRHVVKYKSTYPLYQPLVFHELVHLDFYIQARNAGNNYIFLSTDAHKKTFIKTIDNTIKKLRKYGLSDENIDGFCGSMFEGLNSLIFNNPIDLFIEDYLYITYPNLRPFQLASLIKLTQEGIDAVTNSKVLEFSPSDIIAKIKILNMVSAMLLKDLYGVDLLPQFKSNSREMDEAKRLFEEFNEYRADRNPGEEYELVENWGQDLKLNEYFELVPEEEYRNRTDMNSLFNSLENDPLGLNQNLKKKDKDMSKFLNAQEEIGVNMAVVMYMVGALKYFSAFPVVEIKKIAMDIAMLGALGISPDEKSYRVSSIQDKTFTGYQLLAYYYVSFKMAIPELLAELRLPFDKEFEVAEKMYKEKL